MRDSLNAELDRWTREGLIDQSQAQRIRTFEAVREHSVGWPVRLAVLFGVLMLGAGVLLFVSAHWDELAPAARFMLVLTSVAVLHLSAAAATGSALRSALHAAGTLALGGAIFLTGQIFILEERWSTGVLLWAMGAAAGLILLDDAPQLALTATLVPAWLLSEWAIITENRGDWSWRPALTGLFLLALSYFTADERVIGRRNAAVFRWMAVLRCCRPALGSGPSPSFASIDHLTTRLDRTGLRWDGLSRSDCPYSPLSCSGGVTRGPTPLRSRGRS